MAKRFEVFRKGMDPGRDIKRYSVAIDEFVDRIPAAPIDWKRRGEDEWRRSRTKPALRTTLLGKTLPVGGAFYGRRHGGRGIFIVRAIDVRPPGIPCPDPNATPGARLVWDLAQDATFEAEDKLNRELEFVFMGFFVCRRIDGSSKWSQHAFHNAFDFRIRRAGAPDSSIDTEATTFVVNRIKDEAAESLWLVPGHTYHAHETGPPKLSGIPACA